MQVPTKRDKLMLGLMAVFLIGVVIFLRMPSGGAAADRNSVPLDVAIKRNKQAKEDYRKMTEDTRTLEPRINRMTYNMPPEQLSATITQDLYGLADRAGVHIREIKPLRSRVLSSGSLARVPLEVRFRAPFQPNVMRFLYFTEEPSRKMVVDKINITSTDTRLKSVDVSAQITVYTRYVAGKSSTGAGKGDTSESTDTTN